MTSAEPIVSMGLIGGGPGSFIGPVHRMAAELDCRARLGAGVFSRNLERSREAGINFGIAADRIYPDCETMFAAERARKDGIRFVAIATPNDSHFAIAAAALKAGLHVISDKPATATLEEALNLRTHVRASGCQYALTYTYTGYPLIREARDIVARGEIGTVRKVQAEYPQGWLTEPIERLGDRQASWRTDPAQAGGGGCIGDIGVHAFNLAEYVSGDRVTLLLADLARVVPGRSLDDDVAVLVRFAGGARGVITASQIAAGAGNDLRIRVWGDKGGLDWSHDDHTRLYIHPLNRPSQIIQAGMGYLGEKARASTRLPGGHPEGLIEAFANIYRDFVDSIISGTLNPYLCGIDDGVRGMAFVDTALKSSAAGAVWLPLKNH
jgi:predicted dehydrogenase